MTAHPDRYVSADVEADGPVPGLYSMLLFGSSVAGSFDGTTFERTDPTAATFYRDCDPSHRFEPDYLAASHLDRNHLVEHGADPAQAMTDAAQWVREHAGIRRPVLVAWPLAFDWPVLYWYFEEVSTAGSSFAYDSCLDMKTMYQQKAGVVFDLIEKRRMPPAVKPRRPHTHNALDDAAEQAELFANLLLWRDGHLQRLRC